MILRWMPVGVALLLVGCAERDNPFDPINRPLVRQAGDTGWAPVPRDRNLVLFPESSSRLDKERYSYYSNIQSALRYTYEGDTLWIRGGREYLITGQLTFLNNGSAEKPIVIRSFGGIATIRNPPNEAGKYATKCLDIRGSFVRIVGLRFMNCETGIFAYSLEGPLFLDSVGVENTEIALDLQRIKGRLSLHHMRLVDNEQKPPFLFAASDSLDTLDFSWTPRVD